MLSFHEEKRRGNGCLRSEEEERRVLQMKMNILDFEGKEGGRLSDGGRAGTVVVGVKLDSQSRELLTWALVKVAQAGDRVVALHVLHNTELLDQNGNSSLLSLVKAFESVLAVYEGFCNLKQIDLKLKICRGTSVRRVLVREAKSFTATKVVVGIARNTHTIRSSASIAKYCAKKLPLSCWVLAANNGKVVFQREAMGTVASPGRFYPASQREALGTVASPGGSKIDHLRRATKLFSALHRTLSKNSMVPNGRNSKQLLTWEDKDGKNGRNLEGNCRQDSTHSVAVSDCSGIVDDLSGKSVVRKCSVCASDSSSAGEAHSMQEVSDDSLALVPVQTLEAASSSISLLIRELPELRPGWPLLRRTILPERQSSGTSTVKKISVVQWAMRLPTRHSTVAVHPDHKTINQDVPNLDEESGAIVPVGDVVFSKLDDHELKNLPKELESIHEMYSSTCRLFSYQELLSATSNFSKDNMIGKGGSSQVYKGLLPDGKELAVKILKQSEDALKEFALEIEIVTTLNHKNIICLFGYCFDANELILVYDFIPRGSLEENLHGKKVGTLLSWVERYKVAVGIAEALDYLHNGSTQPVIHRDVKSSNILLGDDFEPQLSDFGLATWASTSSSHITCSDVAGTFGKPISNEYPKGQESLVMWAKPILQSGKVMKLLDPNLGDKHDNDQLERIVMAASLCLRRSPRLRPRINLIMKLLQGDDEVTKWAKFRVSASEEFDWLDDEAYPTPNIQSHLNLVLLDVEDDSLSVSSAEPSLNYLTANKSLEDYLQGRWSRSSSFD
ncbi:hypothetical protein MRB53_033979 [Persea americana]|uniref:Uncharacterized protein n=1 Tax=Persea americana TaxID=3435 RepID=A0ACC2KW30_PERAE|nr:hypothetical protein MRB53_033979 [Persea americana]